MWQNKTGGNELNLGSRLKRALNTGDLTSFKRLVKGGVDVNAKYWFQSTLLHEAVLIGNTEIVKLLLQNNAGVNSENKNGRTPLHLACRGGHVTIVELLLKHSADVNARSDDFQTPLHCAAWRKKMEIVKRLVQSGANVNATDKDGWLPILWAVRQDQPDMVEYLIENGSLLDYHGKPPQTLLMMKPNDHMVQLFLTHGAELWSTHAMGISCVEQVIKDKTISQANKGNIISTILKCGTFYTGPQLIHAANKLTNEKERNTLLQHCDNVDQSLASLCRAKVRCHLKQCCHGRSIYSSVKKLPMPNLLKDYILFSGDYCLFPDISTKLQSSIKR